MYSIDSLRRNVTRDEAVTELRGRGLVRALRYATAGPLRSIADVYVPFRIFRVTIRNGRKRQEKLLAVDAVTGNFDLYSFDTLPRNGQLVRVRTPNRPDPVLNEERTRLVLIDRVRRTVFRTGFFRIRDLQIDAEPVNLDIHVPYWIGFSGFGDRANVCVLDGVRRRIEGGKVRQFFREWLSS
jgi:hypothetical protein